MVAPSSSVTLQAGLLRLTVGFRTNIGVGPGNDESCSIPAHRDRMTYVTRGCPDEDLEVTPVDRPPIAVHIPVREGPVVEGEVDGRRLRRGQLHLLECLELLLGLLLGPGHRMHIDLDDLGGCSGPRVGDRQLDLYVGRLPHCHLRPVVVERGVGPVSYTHLTLT